MKPIVLIAPEHVPMAKGEALLVREAYVKQVRMAGGIAIGAGQVKLAEDYASYADALILPGGDDIHSSRYGSYDKTMDQAMRANTGWDDLDFALCRAFLKLGKPVLGIGRGAEVINACLGGTIAQDLPRLMIVDGKLTNERIGGYVLINEPLHVLGHGFGIHKIHISSGRLLQAADEDIRVNTFHHQAPDRLGEGLRCVAVSEDGVIEAFEHESRPVFGFMWHPEHAYMDVPEDSGIFRRFVDIVKENKQDRIPSDRAAVLIQGGVAFDKVFETPSWVINKTYVNANVAAGSLPLLAVDPEGSEDYADICDGVILTGSFSWSPRPEIAPRLSFESSNKRTAFDEAAFRAFMEAKKPVLGICLGEQMINLYMGGSLSFNFKFNEGREHMMSEHEIIAYPGTVLYEL